MIKYSVANTYVFYLIEKELPNILIALRLKEGEFTYRVFGSSKPLVAPHESDIDLHPMDLPVCSAYGLGLLYRRVNHWANGECTIETALVNDSQFISYYRIKELG